MKSGLKIGDGRDESFAVTEQLSIQIGNVAVLSTPSLIDLMERTSILVLAPFLDDSEQSVGSSVDARHLAPTPVGSRIRISSRVAEISSRRVDFAFEAHDEVEKIAEGSHTRYLVDKAKFRERAIRKLRTST